MLHFVICLTMLFPLHTNPTACGINLRIGLDEAEKHLARARVLDAQDNPEAEQEYKTAIQLRKGYYPEALRQFSIYLRSKLRFTDSAKILGLYLEQVGETDREDVYRELKELQRASVLQARINKSRRPQLRDLIDYINLIGTYGDNKFQDAHPYARRAVSLYPKSSEAYVALAITLSRDRSSERFKLLYKALELNARNAEAHLWLGSEYRSTANLQGSIREYRKAIDVSEGKLAEAWYLLGEVLVLQGDYSEAIEAFSNYLKVGRPSKQSKEVVTQKINELKKYKSQ